MTETITDHVASNDAQFAKFLKVTLAIGVSARPTFGDAVGVTDVAAVGATIGLPVANRRWCCRPMPKTATTRCALPARAPTRLRATVGRVRARAAEALSRGTRATSTALRQHMISSRIRAASLFLSVVLTCSLCDHLFEQ